MTNKKLKMAAMSVALTACVAASPLAANADAPEAAPKELEKEPVAEETKKEENTAEPQVNQEAKNAQKTLKDAEVKYDKEHPTTNPDGSQKLDGVIVTNPEGSGETNPNPGSGETGGETNPNPNPDSGETNPNPNPDSGETNPNPNPNPDSGETDPNPNPNPGSGETGSEEKKPEEKKPEEKEPEKVVIGTAEKTEKSETNVETKPNPGAEPIVDTTTPPTVEKNPDGSTAITQPTVTPGKETTTTTGSGEAKGNLHEKKEEVKEFDLDEELGKNPDISWDIKEGADAVNGYKVDSVTNSDDGNQQTLKLKKEKETTAEMTAEDIAKLVDAEKPTVNPDGTYTLTRTETILDAEGNPQTRTTYITIRDNKVTTKTTTELTITRKKAEQDGSESFRDEMTYPSIQIKGNDDAVVETIKPEDLEKMLNQGTVMDDGIHFTKDGKEYVIQETTQPGETKLSNAEIVDRLKKDGNKNYELGADGEIYYTTPHNETVKLDVTQNELLRRSLTYTVTLKTTEKGDPGTAGEQIATEKAKKDAIRKALTTAVDQLGIEDPATAAQLKAKISDLKFTQEQLDNGGTFTTEEIGGKIYTLTYSAAGAEVTASTPTTDKTDTGKNPEDITDVMDNTVTGTAYVTGSTIIWKGEDQNYDTGAGTLGMGADFTTAPEGATDVKRDPNTGRITSYKDKQGNTHSFTYEENVDLNALTPEEKTALEAAANKDKDGWTTKNLTASLTRVSWTVMSPETTEPKTTPIENGTPVDLSEKTWSSQNGNNGTVDFTHSGTTYVGMTLVNTAEDGKTKTKTETYKKTEDNGTVTIITVTTRQLGEEEIKAKFGSNFISLNDDKTVTYKGKDGKTYTASYVAQEEKLTVEVQKPDVVAATGSTEAEAQTKFLNELEEARIDAEKNKETLVIEYNENGVIKTLKVDHTMKWEEVSMVVGHVVNYNAMTDAELTTYLKELEKTAQKDGKYYTGSTGWDRDTPYYRDASGKMQRVPPGKEIYGKTWDWNHGDWKYHVEINGKEYDVYYNNNDIDHLDLATDSHLTLSEKKDGKSQTTDCVLLNPTLKWSENAETLVNGGGTQANFVDRITYDDEGDKDKNTGHHEYPRASWDDDEFTFTEDNAPTKSVFYKVTGTVAYGKQGNAYKATPSGRDLFGNKYYTDEDYAAARGRAEAALAKYKKEYPDAQVVEICKDQNERGARYYQIYPYQSDLTAYGYMTRDANVCTNATAYKQYDDTEYFGGYDLMISKLVEVRKGQVVGENQSSIKTLFAPISVRSSSTKTKSSMTVDKKTTSTPVGSGTQTNGAYKYDVDCEEKKDLCQSGTGTGSYKSFTNLIQNIFNGDGTGTKEGGFIKYVYHSEKNKDGTPVQFEADKMVVTTKQDAEVHYTFTSQESRDVWIKGYTQTVVPPVNPGPDTPELPPVEDAKPAPAPAPAPETPVLPVVQDARPDPAPTPAPAPETPVLPAVQDAKLIQTGTSGWLADLMLGAGMVLSAAGYWMERKRKAMFYKSQH